jgi:hypothetical protein
MPAHVCVGRINGWRVCLFYGIERLSGVCSLPGGQACIQQWDVLAVSVCPLAHPVTSIRYPPSAGIAIRVTKR